MAVSDLTILSGATQPRLLATEYEGETAFRFDLNGNYEASQTLSPAVGELGGGARFQELSIASQSYVASLGSETAPAALFLVSSGGVLTDAQSLMGAISDLDAVDALATLSLGGTELAFASDRSTGTLASFRLTGGSFQATATTALADVRDLAVVQKGSLTFLFAASADTETIVSYAVGADGTLTEVDSDGQSDGVSIQDPVAIQAASLAGKDYVLVGSTGSNSITVMEVAGSGKLILRDHVIDDQDTRFAALTSLEVVQSGTHTFVVAKGSDDGLSLFALLPGGKLFHIASVEDTPATALDNVTGLAAAIHGNTLKIFATSQSEPGIALVSASLSGLGIVVDGSVASQTITGTSGADILIGAAGDDRLLGQDGDDILRDGTGVDELTGGEGADVFQLVTDGQTDVIIDFDPSEDSLDLSDYLLFQSVSQLTITPTAWGAQITYLDETTDIYSASGGQLTVADFTAVSLKNLSRVPLEDAPGAPVISSGLDPNRGGKSLEFLVERALEDIAAGVADATFADLGFSVSNLTLPSIPSDQRTRDLALADVLDNGGDDNLTGTNNNDVLLGGDGTDLLDGRAGDDLLSGGAGADAFVFQDGFGDDRVTDFEIGSDALDFAGHSGVSGMAQLTFADEASGVRISLAAGGDDTILLEGILAGELSASDFVFA
ncbi:MAG: hypothetical protein AAF667_14165 [Pseudomonadota bacterium]